MSVHLMILIGAFCIGMTGVIVGNMLLYAMIGEINRKKQEGQPVSYLGFSPPKIARIHREYRRLYPNGRLHFYTIAALAVQMAGMVTVGVCLLTMS